MQYFETLRGERSSFEQFRTQGFDLVFIHCGRSEGRIASMHWIDDNGSSTASEDQHLTRIMVTLWDIGSSLNRLSEVTGVAVAQFSPNGQYLAVGRVSQNIVELWNFEDSKITHRFLHSFCHSTFCRPVTV